MLASPLAEWGHCYFLIQCRPEPCEVEHRVPVRSVLQLAPDVTTGEARRRLRRQGCGRNQAVLWAVCKVKGQTEKRTALIGTPGAAWVG